MNIFDHFEENPPGEYTIAKSHQIKREFLEFLGRSNCDANESLQVFSSEIGLSKGAVETALMIAEEFALG